jgi:hypothetical protein
MAMAVKFNTGQEVCLQIPSARGVMQVKEGTSGSTTILATPAGARQLTLRFRKETCSAKDFRVVPQADMASTPFSSPTASRVHEHVR